jgi:hypothetical protein
VLFKAPDRKDRHTRGTGGFLRGRRGGDNHLADSPPSGDLDQGSGQVADALVLPKGPQPGGDGPEKLYHVAGRADRAPSTAVIEQIADFAPAGSGRTSVWVPNWSSTLCHLGVFVYQPVEQVATSQVKLGWRCR